MTFAAFTHGIDPLSQVRLIARAATRRSRIIIETATCAINRLRARRFVAGATVRFQVIGDATWRRTASQTGSAVINARPPSRR